MKKPVFNTPQEALRYHVTGAIERGEGQAIVGKPAPWPVICADLSNAVTKQELERVEKRATRFYNAGLITAKELQRIDVRVMECLAELETA